MIRMAAMQEGRFPITRIQTNVIARQERQLLDWICARLPLSVKPDHLTITGLSGAILVFASYVASLYSPAFLWLASFGLVVHWLGDSLDGSLARYRHIERPIYGYFLDHTVDAISNLVIMVGIGSSPFVRMDAALFALIGYYLLCIYVFINNHLSGVLQLSFMGFGPTELRLGLIAINTAMIFVGPVGIRIGGESLSIYDCILLLVGTIFALIFLTRMISGFKELREPDGDGAHQSASRNPSSRSK